MPASFTSEGVFVQSRPAAKQAGRMGPRRLAAAAAGAYWARSAGRGSAGIRRRPPGAPRLRQDFALVNSGQFSVDVCTFLIFFDVRMCNSATASCHEAMGGVLPMSWRSASKQAADDDHGAAQFPLRLSIEAMGPVIGLRTRARRAGAVPTPGGTTWCRRAFRMAPCEGAC